MLFGIVADVAEIQQAAANDPSVDTVSSFAMLATAIANSLSEKTWLTGISEAVELMTAKDKPWVVERFLQNRAGSFVPFSGLGGQSNQLASEHLKEARGYIDKMKSRVPGMSGDLPTRHSWITGDPIETPTMLFGFIKSKGGPDDLVGTELRKLNYGFSGPDRRIGEVELSTEHYQEWRKLMGTIRINGRTLHAQLERVMKSKRYDLERSRIPDGIAAPGEGHREAIIREWIAAYKEQARAELLDNHPQLEDIVRRAERYDARARAGKAQEGEREALILRY